MSAFMRDLARTRDFLGRGLRFWITAPDATSASSTAGVASGFAFSRPMMHGHFAGHTYAVKSEVRFKVIFSSHTNALDIIAYIAETRRATMIGVVCLPAAA